MDRTGIQTAGKPHPHSKQFTADAQDGDQLTELSSERRELSNLERFLDCTTPRVLFQNLPKMYACWKGWSTCTQTKFFFLADLWDSFDEWSAYGAGVPIVLNGGKGTVVQYYVPYLSALQLYASSTNSIFTKARRLSDDSETSESDARESSSDSSSDSECDREMGYDRAHCWQRFEASGPWDSQLDSGEFELDSSSEFWQDDRPGHLLFEYFEKAAPCIRVPLFDKVGKLVHTFPALRSLSSLNLHPSSWMSVAWYPIYRIPTGPTIMDLAACFLTYHSLSMTDQQQDVQSVKEPPNKFLLQPFGLAAYKFQGPVWNSEETSGDQRATSLQKSVDSWIKRLDVRHPDYEHFIYYRPSLRH